MCIVATDCDDSDDGGALAEQPAEPLMRCGMLHVACCILRVMLHVHVAPLMAQPACCMWHVACCMLRVACAAAAALPSCAHCLKRHSMRMARLYGILQLGCFMHACMVATFPVASCAFLPANAASPRSRCAFNGLPCRGATQRRLRLGSAAAIATRQPNANVSTGFGGEDAVAGLHGEVYSFGMHSAALGMPCAFDRRSCAHSRLSARRKSVSSAIDLDTRRVMLFPTCCAALRHCAAVRRDKPGSARSHRAGRLASPEYLEYHA